MNIAAQTLYTQKDLIDILGTPRQTLSRQLPEDGYYLVNADSGHKVKAYPLCNLPEDMRHKISVMELADQEEALLPVPEKDQPRKLKPWQNEVLKARLWVLLHVRSIAFIPENLPQAEKDFAKQSQNGELPEEIATIVDLATAKNKGKGVSYTTLRSWRALYNKHGEDALAPMDTKAPKTPKWLNGFMQAWQIPGRPTVKQVYDGLMAQGVDLPSLRTVERWIAKLGKIEAGKGRLGMLDLKQYRIHSIRKTDDLLPTDIYTADGQSGKFYVQNPYTGKPFKPELVTVMDVATRMVVGFAAGLAENSLNTLAALTDAMENYGVPAIFYSDRGPGFKNKMLDDPVNQL